MRHPDKHDSHTCHQMVGPLGLSAAPSGMCHPNPAPTPRGFHSYHIFQGRLAFLYPQGRIFVRCFQCTRYNHPLPTHLTSLTTSLSFHRYEQHTPTLLLSEDGNFLRSVHSVF